VRAGAARAAGALGSTALLDQLAGDASALVRESVLGARAALDPSADAALFARFLGDPSTGVRGAVLDRLARSPVAPFEAVLGAFAKDERATPELAVGGVAALRARAETTAAERGAIVTALEGLTEVGTWPVRVAAADALEALGRPRPPTGTATTARSPADYRSMTARSRRPRWIRLETPSGQAVLRVDCDQAPLQSIAFLQLAGQGFYDGSMVYRAVLGARLEAGDPDGDGRGGPGFTVRDEAAPRRLVRGSFGLVRPAAHAAGSRFFVQLDDDGDGAAPAADGAGRAAGVGSPGGDGVAHGAGGAAEGEVTILGEVASGLDVIESLIEGDRIVRLREIAAPPELHSERTGHRPPSRPTGAPARIAGTDAPAGESNP
jgi:cyclophilin family peptidyl-prolyl cis-trans isomerase